MKKVLFLGLLCSSLAMAGPTLASDIPVPGQKMSAAQLARWGDLPTYRIDKSEFRVLPLRPSDPQLTLLVNAQGVVGVSRNEVTIANASAGAASGQLQRSVPQPLSVTRFEQAAVTVARYADFDQAYQGYQTLQASMPDAQVRLPVHFGQVQY